MVVDWLDKWFQLLDIILILDKPAIVEIKRKAHTISCYKGVARRKHSGGCPLREERERGTSRDRDR